MRGGLAASPKEIVVVPEESETHHWILDVGDVSINDIFIQTQKECVAVAVTSSSIENPAPSEGSSSEVSRRGKE